jgi:hypothetical protein
MFSPDKFYPSNSAIQESLESTRCSILSYRKMLKQEAILLFIATLGCWSVPFRPLQWIAFAIILLIFANKMSEQIKGETSLSKTFDLMHDRILLELPPDIQKVWLLDFEELKHTKQDWIFVLCGCFYGLSLAYEIFSLF